jgi:hypothetical protein
VSEPLALVKRVSSFMRPSGYLYIEVPQERTDAEIAALKRGTIPSELGIHEHINLYCSSSVARLVEAAGLEPIKIEAFPIDLGWVTSTIIRALCKKRA